MSVCARVHAGRLTCMDAECSPNLGPMMQVHADQKTAAHWAGATGHVEMIKLLLENGATLDALDKHGNTVLAVAQKKRQTEVVKFLSEKLGVAAEEPAEKSTKKKAGSKK